MVKYLLKDAVEHPLYSGYYYAICNARFAVNRDGRIIDTVLDACLLPTIPSNPLSYIRMYDPVIKDTSLLHRMVAEIFQPCPGEFDDYIVNHLNGVKSDNWADNLEWTTYSGNSIHAYQTGLRNDNKPVILKNLEDDTITEFYALNRCAEYLGINPSILHVYLNGNMDGPLCTKYTAIYKGSMWPLLTIDNIGGHRNGLAKNIIYITPEGKRVICASVSVAAKLLNTPAHNIYGYLNKNSKQFTLPGYTIMYLADYKECIKGLEVVSKERSRKPQNLVRKAVPIRVTDTKTGVVTDWESVGAFATAYNVKRNSVQKRMHVTGGRWNIFKIEYL